MLVGVYGFDVRVGMEFQRYSTIFAVKLISIFIVSSAVILSVGFIAGVLLSKCSRGRRFGISLGVSYGIFSLLVVNYFDVIANYLGIYSYILIWVFGGLFILGGFMIPFLIVLFEKQLKKLSF